MVIVCGSVAVLATGCGDDGQTATDAAQQPDGPVATIDAAPPDAAQPDAAQPDATMADAGPVAQGCPDPVDPNVVQHQYIIDRKLMPANASEASMRALDLDGAEPLRRDNQLGQVQVALASQTNTDLQAQMDALFATGQILQLVNVQTTSLITAPETSYAILFGQDQDGNPADNFSGAEPFDIRADSPPNNVICGSTIASQLTLGPGDLTVETNLFVFGSTLVRLPMIGAQVVGTIDANGIINGIIGGAIVESDVNTIVVPALHISLTQSTAADCMSGPPMCCTPGSSGETIMAIFDDNGDCTIALAEVQNNALIASLLAPDVDLLDSNNGNVFAPNQDGIKDALSYGIGFTAVGATFTAP